MNFEFKSTFIYNKCSMQWPKPAAFKTRHAIWIIAVNLTSFAVLTWLYLTNTLIPGTYASGPFGQTIIELVEWLAILWILSSTYAVLRLLHDNVLPPDNKITVSALLHHRDALRELTRAIALHIIMLFHIMVREPCHGYTHSFKQPIHILIKL